jgi:hypothetical protein
MITITMLILMIAYYAYDYYACDYNCHAYASAYAYAYASCVDIMHAAIVQVVNCSEEMLHYLGTG